MAIGKRPKTRQDELSSDNQGENEGSRGYEWEDDGGLGDAEQADGREGRYGRKDGGTRREGPGDALNLVGRLQPRGEAKTDLTSGVLIASRLPAESRRPTPSGGAPIA